MSTPTSIVEHRVGERDPIAQWVHSQLQTRGEHSPEYVELEHLDLNDRSSVMERYDIVTCDTHEALAISAKARAQAGTDAEIRGGTVQRYCLRAYWPAGTRHPTHHLFTIDAASVGRAADAGFVAPSEPATVAGLLKQMMRHNEVMLDMATRQTRNLMADSDKREARLQARIEHLEENRMRVLELQEAMVSAKAERDLEVTRAEGAEKRRDAALAEFKPFVPILRAKMLEWVTGQKAGQGTSAADEMLRSIFTASTQDELRAMMSALPVDKQPLLLECYRSVMNVPKPKDGEGSTTDDKPPEGPAH